MTETTNDAAVQYIKMLQEIIQDSETDLTECCRDSLPNMKYNLVEIAAEFDDIDGSRLRKDELEKALAKKGCFGGAGRDDYIYRCNVESNEAELTSSPP